MKETMFCANRFCPNPVFEVDTDNLPLKCPTCGKVGFASTLKYLTKDGKPVAAGVYYPPVPAPEAVPGDPAFEASVNSGDLIFGETAKERIAVEE